MTDDEVKREVLPVVYRLGVLIEEKRWEEALSAWQWLLNTYAPLATMQPCLERVLANNATLVALAERQTSKIH